jgi:hypothetical protein
MQCDVRRLMRAVNRIASGESAYTAALLMSGTSLRDGSATTNYSRTTFVGLSKYPDSTMCISKTEPLIHSRISFEVLLFLSRSYVIISRLFHRYIPTLVRGDEGSMYPPGTACPIATRHWIRYGRRRIKD